MSFILDALKKSEAERQRQAGPTLLELRVTQPRRRYPLWALVVGALLAANVAVLLIFLLNRPPTAAAPVAASTPGALSAARNSVPAAPAAAPVRTIAVPAAQPLAANAGTSAGAGTSTVTRVPPLAAAPGAGSALAPAAASGGGVVGPSEQTGNPADYEPALPAGSQPPSPVTASQAGAADYSNLPSISQISGNVPAMQLDILVSSDVVSERYALINMHRVHEGDVLANGARVVAITPNGVAMDYHGQDFLLRPGGTPP